MTMKELTKYTEEELYRISCQMAIRGNMVAVKMISYVKEFYNKDVKVVKGRKVPHGVTGKCFWMGSYDHSKYGDPWGIYTSVRVGIKDIDGNVYWTSVDNIEVIQDTKSVD